ncbi:MAG TPA: hypothetical protein VHP38_06335 [Ruminiclostridium sp.]|nr:hypothetical protein [Ruminiclostridium sp.]
MTRTNWQDPKSTEIRSTHISGLQEAVGKLEDSIGILTVLETDIPLNEVFISNDDRCRIYQAPEGKRNWLSSPSPIIKQNGVVITDDFEIDYGGGAVIFTTPILETDVIMASFKCTLKIEGKQLSIENYSSEEKNKLSGIENGANKYIHPETHPANMIELTDGVNLVDSITKINQALIPHLSALVTDSDGTPGLKVESGTWTPIASGTWSTKPAATNGRYFKIGKSVICYISFMGGIKEGIKGYFSGLPFPLAAGTIGTTSALSNVDIINKGFVSAFMNGNIYLTDDDFSSGGTHTTSIKK